MREYQIEDEGTMILAEPSIEYGNVLMKGESDYLDDWDNAPAQWDIDSPEMQELINLGLKIAIEQIKRGDVYSAEEVEAEMNELLK